MSGLLDDIRRHGPGMPWFIAPDSRVEWRRHRDRIMELLRCDIPVIDANNVSTWYFETNMQEDWDLARDFPNMTPPFPVFFIEYIAPKVISSPGGVQELPDYCRDARIGVLVIASKREDVTGEDIPEGAHWVIVQEVFIASAGLIQGSPGTIVICLNKTGHIVGVPWVQHFAPEQFNEQMKERIGFIFPAMLAVCFLNQSRPPVQVEVWV